MIQLTYYYYDVPIYSNASSTYSKYYVFWPNASEQITGPQGLKKGGIFWTFQLFQPFQYSYICYRHATNTEPPPLSAIYNRKVDRKNNSISEPNLPDLLYNEAWQL